MVVVGCRLRRKQRGSQDQTEVGEKQQSPSVGGPCFASSTRQAVGRTFGFLNLLRPTLTSRERRQLYPDNSPVSDNQQSKWVTPQVSGTQLAPSCARMRRNRQSDRLGR